MVSYERIVKFILTIFRENCWNTKFDRYLSCPVFFFETLSHLASCNIQEVQEFRGKTIIRLEIGQMYRLRHKQSFITISKT